MRLRNRIFLFVSVSVIGLTWLSSVIIYLLFAQYREEEFQQRLKEKIRFTIDLIKEYKELSSNLSAIMDKHTIHALYDEKILVFDGDKNLIYKSLDDLPIHGYSNLLHELSLQNQISQTQLENTVVQKELKIWIQVPENIFLYVQDTLSSPTYYSLDAGLLSALTDTALSLRPDARQAALEYAYYDKRLAYEKSLKTPDITLKGGYDRGGNFMFNFIGFGLALDIPVFHRNQGHIAWARLARDQADLLLQVKKTEVRQEVAAAFFSLGQAVKFFATMDPQYDAQLDAMMDSYERNYQNRLISLLEFNDFMTAYLDNKKALLDAVRRVQECTEELYFSIGKDVVLNP